MFPFVPPIPLHHTVLQGPLVLKHLLSSKGLLHETKLWFKSSWVSVAGIEFARESCHSLLIVVREIYIGLKRSHDQYIIFQVQGIDGALETEPAMHNTLGTYVQITNSDRSLPSLLQRHGSCLQLYTLETDCKAKRTN